MKPTFKTLDDKRAKQREKRNDDHFEVKRGTVRRSENPRSQSKLIKSKRSAKRNENPTASYPQEARNASGTGTVKISVWGSGSNNGEKVKKTGALSPRAPEKIKKNRSEEMKIYGENACITLFQQRPESIIRLWATVEGAKKLGEMTSYLAKSKKAYHVVDRAEMERVTGTEHHGEMCLLVKKATAMTLEGYLQIRRHKDCLVLLDNVNNAQNIGGVIRTCAFYGVKGIIVENADSLNSSAAARVAEGGLEFIHSLETKHKQIALAQLRQAGYQIVHLTRNKQTKSLAKTRLSEKVVFVLSEILAAEVEYQEDTTVSLSFANPLNSGLNVAVSAGVVLSHWYAQ